MRQNLEKTRDILARTHSASVSDFSVCFNRPISVRSVMRRRAQEDRTDLVRSINPPMKPGFTESKGCARMCARMEAQRVRKSVYTLAPRATNSAPLHLLGENTLDVGPSP